MDSIDLQIIGEVPEHLDLTPLEVVVMELVSRTEQLNLPSGEINLTFVDDVEIQKLNLEYSGNDYATDVLSFSYLESGGPIENVIGEIAISVETANRQADNANMSLGEEVALLAMHGILHIAGLDHQSEEEQSNLQDIQREIMQEAKLTYREFEWVE